MQILTTHPPARWSEHSRRVAQKYVKRLSKTSRAWRSGSADFQKAQTLLTCSPVRQFWVTNSGGSRISTSPRRIGSSRAFDIQDQDNVVLGQCFRVPDNSLCLLRELGATHVERGRGLWAQQRNNRGQEGHCLRGPAAKRKLARRNGGCGGQSTLPS